MQGLQVLGYFAIIGAVVSTSSIHSALNSSKGQEPIGPIDWNCTGNGVFPKPDNCSHYVECWMNNAILWRCTDTMLFDLTYMGCNWPQYVNCGNRPGGPFRCPTPDGYFPDPESCLSFYVCERSIAYKNYCQPGLWYNPNTRACDYPGDFCSIGNH